VTVYGSTPPIHVPLLSGDSWLSQHKLPLPHHSHHPPHHGVSQFDTSHIQSLQSFPSSQSNTGHSGQSAIIGEGSGLGDGLHHSPHTWNFFRGDDIIFFPTFADTDR
jgi:hypothetical protein